MSEDLCVCPCHLAHQLRCENCAYIHERLGTGTNVVRTIGLGEPAMGDENLSEVSR